MVSNIRNDIRPKRRVAKLDLMRFPLVDRQVIEASAGTGKTFSITALHLRALLGHGTSEPVGIDRILVVTFTEAATEELRERVRSRLFDMRQLLRGTVTRSAADPFLVELLDALPDHELAARRVELAMQQMNEAAIHTIHGFCVRALKEHAFESGVPFDHEFVLDDQMLLSAALVDAWRQLVYPRRGAELALLHSLFDQPQDLLKLSERHVARADLVVDDVHSAGLDVALADCQSALQLVSAAVDDLQMPARLAECNLSKSKAAMTAHGDGIQELIDAARADHGVMTHPDVPVDALLQRYASATIAKLRLKPLKRGFDDDFADFSVLADAALLALQRLRNTVVVEALELARLRADSDKQRNRVVSSNDVLKMTAGALGDSIRGARFAARLRARYPVAMIDEFQDTDPVQWQIFDQIYQDPHDDDGPRQEPASGPTSGLAPGAPTTCVLIGDPKQAIYSFRGADVFSYLAARNSIAADAQHELTASFRSPKALVDGMNRLYAGKDAFASPDIWYSQLTSGLKRGSFKLGNRRPAPLTFCVVPEALPNRDEARRIMSADSAQRIVHLLHEGRAKIDDVPLQPGQVAVLVRDRFDAAAMLQALAAVGQPASYLNRDSVFRSQAAGWMQQLLHCLLEVHNEALMRGVLASPLGGWSLATLHASGDDDLAWQGEVEAFRRYARLWQDSGVLVMLRAFLSDRQVASRLLREGAVVGGDGARVLTDLRHLGELLQSESARVAGRRGMVRWLEQRMSDAIPDEVHQLRLESDDALVKVVTIHAAKGLEWDVVMVPFLTLSGLRQRDVWHRATQGDNGAAQGFEAVLELPEVLPGSRAEQIAHAQHEELAEDLRLAYVALTRARRACFVGVCDQRWGGGIGNTALGRLLSPGPPLAVADGATSESVAATPTIDLAAIKAHLATLAQDPQIAVETVEDRRSARWPGDQQGLVSKQPPRRFDAAIDRRWRVHSYSSLTGKAGNDHIHLTPGGFDEMDVVDTLVSEQLLPALPEVNDARFDFARGPVAGVCLHEMLERWTPPHDADSPGTTTDAVAIAAQKSMIGEQLRSHGLNVEQDIHGLHRWLAQVRATRLAPLPVSLDDIPQLVPEIEFLLPLRDASGAQLQRTVQAAGYYTDGLPQAALSGMLKGFIDAVFEYEGRFYLVDYKSNWLGGDLDDYAPEVLGAAMASHQYELQGLLYAVALRRWLRLRGVAAAAAVPGMFYLFLRGMDGATARGIWFHEPPVAVLDALDDCFEGRVADGA